MIISRPKAETTQLTLFDYPIDETDHGYARHVVGELIEDLSAYVLGGSRHRTDSRADYCPDVSVRSIYGYRGSIAIHQTHYYECKAAGLSKQFFIYGERLKKDIRFARKRDLSYLIWHHRARTKSARSVAELRSLLLQRIVCGYIVPFSVINTICASIEETKLNSAYGHSIENGKLYGSGFRIPLRMIESYRAIEYRYETH